MQTMTNADGESWTQDRYLVDESCPLFQKLKYSEWAQIWYQAIQQLSEALAGWEKHKSSKCACKEKKWYLSDTMNLIGLPKFLAPFDKIIITANQLLFSNSNDVLSSLSYRVYVVADMIVWVPN